MDLGGVATGMAGDSPGREGLGRPSAGSVDGLLPLCSGLTGPGVGRACFWGATCGEWSVVDGLLTLGLAGSRSSSTRLMRSRLRMGFSAGDSSSSAAFSSAGLAAGATSCGFCGFVLAGTTFSGFSAARLGLGV